MSRATFQDNILKEIQVLIYLGLKEMKKMKIWDKLFKNGPSKICLPNFKISKLSSKDLTWSILEYFVPYIM